MIGFNRNILTDISPLRIVSGDYGLSFLPASLSLVFTGTGGIYNLPALSSNDFSLKFRWFPATLGAGTEQILFNLSDSGDPNNGIQIYQYGDSKEMSVESLSGLTFLDDKIVEDAWNYIHIFKIGSTIKLSVNNTVNLDSFVDAAIIPSAWDTLKINDGTSKILNGNKLMITDDLWRFPRTGESIKAWQDLDKTIPVTADGQTISVIETPNGDIVTVGSPIGGGDVGGV